MASPPRAVAHLPTFVLGTPPLPGDESIRARLKACLLMGDMNCVVTQYLLLKDLGRVPDWLVAFQNAFSVANQKAGACEKVARTVHESLLKLGQRPEFIRFTIHGPARVMGFDEISNDGVAKTHQLSTLGYHVAVKLGDRVIDTYTGLAGLPVREYTARLSTSPGSQIVDEVVQSL